MEALLEESCQVTSYTVKKDDEIWEFWVNKSIEDVSDAQPDRITWLEKHRQMLEQVSD